MISTKRVLTVVGIVLVVASALLLLFGGPVRSGGNVWNVGGVTVSAAEQGPSRPWAAGLSLIAGIVFVVAGAQRRGAGQRR